MKKSINSAITILGISLLVLLGCGRGDDKEQKKTAVPHQLASEKVKEAEAPLKQEEIPSTSLPVPSRGEYLCSKYSGARSATYYDEDLNYVVVDCRNYKEYYVGKSTASGQEIWFLRDITQTWTEYGTNKVTMDVIPLSSTSLENSTSIMYGVATGKFSLKQVGKNLWRVTGAKTRISPYPFPKELKR